MNATIAIALLALSANGDGPSDGACFRPSCCASSGVDPATAGITLGAIGGAAVGALGGFAIHRAYLEGLSFDESGFGQDFFVLPGAVVGGLAGAGTGFVVASWLASPSSAHAE